MDAKQLAVGVLMAGAATVCSAQLVEPPGMIKLAKQDADKPKKGASPLTVGSPIAAPNGNLLKLGMGYNALTDEYQPNVCVVGSAPNLTYGQGELSGTLDRKRIRKVSNMAEGGDASGSDVGFDFTYKLVTVGFATGSSSSSYYNSIDQYARVYVRVATQGEGLIDPVWTPRGKLYAPGSLRNFVDKCGTHYIRALYKGHLLDQTYRFVTDKSTITTGGKNDLSLGVGKIFGLDYADNSSTQKISDNSSLSIDETSRGVGETVAKPPDGSALVMLVRYADEQFTQVARTAPKDKAVLILMELAPYRTVPQSNNIPGWPNDMMGFLTSRTGLYQMLASASGDLQFAQQLSAAKLAELYSDTPEQVTEKATKAQGYRDAFAAAARECRETLVKGVQDAVAIKQCEDGLSAAVDESKVASIRLHAK